MYCKKCNYEIEEDSEFCNKCGEKFLDEQREANLKDSNNKAIFAVVIIATGIIAATFVYIYH